MPFKNYKPYTVYIHYITVMYMIGATVQMYSMCAKMIMSLVVQLKPYSGIVMTQESQSEVDIWCK